MSGYEQPSAIDKTSCGWPGASWPPNVSCSDSFGTMESKVVDKKAAPPHEIEQQLSRNGIELSPAERGEVILAYGDLFRLLGCLRRVDRGPQIEMLPGYIPDWSEVN